MKVVLFWLAALCLYACIGGLLVAMWQMAPGPLERFVVIPAAGFISIVLGRVTWIAWEELRP